MPVDGVHHWGFSRGV